MNDKSKAPAVTDESGKQEADAPKEKVLLDIINGRMPLALVYAIRFEEGSESKDSELATKYKTSVGKISDIRKSRNFGYITEDMNFSKADIDGALAYLQKATLKGNNFTADEIKSITKVVKALNVSEGAGDEITAARKAGRKVKETAEDDKGGTTDNTGSDAGSDLDAAI